LGQQGGCQGLIGFAVVGSDHGVMSAVQMALHNNRQFRVQMALITRYRA
jgi:hypothetical protein